MKPALETRWLGRIAFEQALAQQDALVQKKHSHPDGADEFWLLEHEPVYTIGRTPDRSSLRGSNHLPHPLFEINRGGQATYHGPGQLVGYLLLDLRRYGQDLHRYLRWMESLLINLLALYKVKAGTRDGLTGVWVANRKIASIGVGVRHWITMHGFALNVHGDLSGFDAITPCGIANVAMTSIEKETGETQAVKNVGEAIASLTKVRVADLAGSTGRRPVGAGNLPARTFGTAAR